MAKDLVTVTYDQNELKLVPIKATEAMANAPDLVYTVRSCVWADMLAAVPAQLPGVVVHNGEPVMYRRQVRTGIGSVIWVECDATDVGAQGLFTHPAPDPKCCWPACEAASSQEAEDALMQKMEARDIMLVKAALEAAIQPLEINMMKNGGLIKAIRAIDPQTIINRVTGDKPNV